MGRKLLSFALSSSALSNPIVLLVRGEKYVKIHLAQTSVALTLHCTSAVVRLLQERTALSTMVQQNLFLLVREVLRALEHGKLPSPALFRQLLSKAGIILFPCPSVWPQEAPHSVYLAGLAIA